MPLARTDDRSDYPIPTSTCGYSTTTDPTTGVSKHLYVDYRFGNITIRIIVVHFVAFPTDRARCAQREGQATVIASLVQQALDAGYEVVVMGDVNDFDGAIADIDNNSPRSTVLNILKDPNRDGENDLFNVMGMLPRAERFTAFWDSQKNGDDGARDRSAIDHVLLSPGLYVNVTKVETRSDLYGAGTISDHWPLMVTISLKGRSVSCAVSSTPWSGVAWGLVATVLLSVLLGHW
jgi:endonuclease/exonuclease/phosphatase family metal-dependent hydrolase